MSINRESVSASDVSASLVGACRSICALALLALAPAFTASAAETDCKPLFEAMSKLFNTPSHQYLTQINAAPGAKPQSGEIINTGTTVYILVDGQWQKSAITATQLQAQEEQNRSNAKLRICKLEGEETVDGVTVAHFSAHTETGDVVSEEQIWISKSAGLPVRETMDIDMGNQGKSRAEIRVVYKGVTAPSGL